MLLREKIPFLLLLACSILLLSGCTSDIDSEADLKDALTADEDSNLAVRTISGSVTGAIDTVQTPLVDLNIKRSEIPEHLQSLSGNPYDLPSPLQCKVMSKELADLDVLLGPDMQKNEDGEAEDKGHYGYVEDGASMLQSSAIGFVTSKASIIPFRGIVRKITGAEKHSKALALAYQSGKLRRAYLKGLSSALKCDKKTKKAKKKTKSQKEITLSANTAK
ncbi:MAG: hypothetical protein ACN2B6_10990 [Rickettsiales bacterium]